MLRAFVVAAVSACCLTICVGYEEYVLRHDEFEVKFGTKKTLGLKLDDQLKVRSVFGALALGPHSPLLSSLPV